MVLPIQETKSPECEKPIPRVTALDAVDLDSEIQRILKDQLLKIIHILSPSWTRWEPELDLFLSLIVWKLSLYQLGATFGQQLLSIRYDKHLTRRRAVAWAALTVGTRYLHQRAPELTSLVVQPQHRDKVREWLGRLETTVQVVRLANLLMFLRQGRFPDLVDRVTGSTPVAAASVSRLVGYSYMTRELMWHGFVELIVFLLPLVNFSSLQRTARRWLGPARSAQRREPLVYTTATRCAVCHEPPVLPHHTGCGHAFCYYCLQANRAVDAKFECPTCNCSTDDPAAVQPVTSALCTPTL